MRTKGRVVEFEMRGRIGAGRCHAIRTLSHYTDNMDNVPNEGSAVRYHVFRKLREKAGGAWEADALPTELFPLNDLRGPYLDWGPNRGQRSTWMVTRSLTAVLTHLGPGECDPGTVARPPKTVVARRT